MSQKSGLNGTVHLTPVYKGQKSNQSITKVYLRTAEILGLCDLLLMGIGQEQQHPAAPTGGVSWDRAVAVGISDM